MNDIGFNHASDLALEHIAPLGTEDVSAEGLVGRVCAHDVIALIDYPSSDSSLKDGYAVVSQDVAAACISSPVRLSVEGMVGAGEECMAEVSKGTTVRVLSGSPIPLGADAVLAEEFAQVGHGHIEAIACAEPGRNILFKGDEIANGQMLARTGQVITPSIVSLLVAGGINRVSVFRRPLVGLLATGNEVLLPGKKPETGKLFASNLALQQAWLRSRSIETIIRQAGDSLEELGAAVESLLSNSDVLLTSGGAWKGDRDLIVKALDMLGWDQLFHRVRIGPGKAVGMGFLEKKPIFCLPGGPPSNEIAFLMLAFPAVLRMAGFQGFPYPRLTGILTEEVGGQEDWTQVIHCRAERQGSEFHLVPLDRKQRLRAMARSDGFVIVPEGVESIPAGSSVEFICLNHETLFG
jgi:molybdopterin molybdotransferase